MLRCNAKHTKYLLLDDVFSSLNFGGSPFDWSLFTDTELNTSETDLSLTTQRAERESVCDFYKSFILHTKKHKIHLIIFTLNIKHYTVFLLVLSKLA